ncbi:MAG: AAA family ATPase [Saprospiraceae bacterium]|nr:AAA family ATPase [Saprospiraceae bacterium]
MLQRNFNQVWDQLRANKAQRQEFLESVTIKNIRGIDNLTVRFEYPVSVLAGPNASGKSTVLFACACAYKVPGTSAKDFVPSTLFPNLSSRIEPALSDQQQATQFEFYYIHKGNNTSMKWARGKSWNRSYMGKKGGAQPERRIYVRTLANLTSPTEVRSVLQIGKGSYHKVAVTSDLIAFAQRILPLKYREVVLLKKGLKDLLFAQRDDTSAQYSEFHMSSGERALLRISTEISNLKDALVLIDKIEAGLHPFTQQQIMLELQRLALRNNLQIIVTTHSPVVLDSVPIEARIFLERTNDNVIVKPPFKDVIQKAFYGQSLEKLFVLCEDETAEAFLNGCFDVLNPRLGLVHDDVAIGRDTSKDEFLNHIAAIGKFQQLQSFLFVLDGDARNKEAALKNRAADFGASIQPLFIPGAVPESWALDTLRNYPGRYGEMIGMKADDLSRLLMQSDQIFTSAQDKPANIAKNKFYSICEQNNRTPPELMRLIARSEAENPQSDMKVFMEELEIQVRNWQSRK